MLEVLKNTIPSRLLNNLHVAVDTAKRILAKERLYRQLVGQGSDAIPSIALKGVKEPKQNTVTFSEESVMNDKIDKLTSFIGNLGTQVTQNRQLRLFNQGSGRPLNNFSRGNWRYNDGNRGYGMIKKVRGCNTFRGNRNSKR